MDRHNTIFVISSYTKKVFANMKREGKDFSRKVTLLFVTMMVQAPKDMGKEAKTAQAKEIASLKKRVKKLEQKRKSRTLGLRILRNGRMNEEDMFRVNDIDGDEVVVDVSAITTVGIKVTTAATTLQISKDELTLAQTLIEIKEAKPKAITTTATTLQISKDELTLAQTLIEIKAAKPKAITTTVTTITTVGTRPKPERPLKRKDQIMMDKEVAKNPEAQMQAKLEEEERLARLKEEETNIALWIEAFVPMDTKLVKGRDKAVEGSEKVEECTSKRAGSNLEQEDTKRQMLEEENESTELKRCLEIIPEDDDDVTIKATLVSSKSPTIIDYKIYKAGKKSYFKIIIAYERFKKTKPIDDIENLLFQTLKTMLEHHVEDNIWKYQQGSGQSSALETF
nr:hypothetical protein [Tanacetum cinerariifolium]